MDLVLIGVSIQRRWSDGTSGCHYSMCLAVRCLGGVYIQWTSYGSMFYDEELTKLPMMMPKPRVVLAVTLSTTYAHSV